MEPKYDNNYIDIDGLKIINREKGWEEEWGKVINYLFDEKTQLVKKKVTKALNPYKDFIKQNSHESFDDIRDGLVTDFWEYINNMYADVKKGTDGKILPAESNYDPSQGKFINYLLCSIKRCHMFQKHIEKTGKGDFILTRRLVQAIMVKARKEGWSQERIDEELKKVGIKFTPIDLPKPDDPDSSNSDWLATGDKPDENHSLTTEDALDETPPFLKFIQTMFIDYLDKACQSRSNDHKLDQNYRQAGAQMYPAMTGQRCQVDEDHWIPDGENPSLKRVGIQWILGKTLQLIENNNPDQPADKTLLECHIKALFESDCRKDDDKSKLAIPKMTQKQIGFVPLKLLQGQDYVDQCPEFINLVSPIDNNNDLIRLFGLTPNNVAAEKSRYRRFAVAWEQRNNAKIREALSKLGYGE